MSVKFATAALAVVALSARGVVCSPMSCVGTGAAGEYHVACNSLTATSCLFSDQESCTAGRLTDADGSAFIFASGAAADGSSGSHVVDNLGSDSAALSACHASIRERAGRCALFCLQRDINGVQRYIIYCDQSGDLLQPGCLSQHVHGLECPPQPNFPQVTYVRNDSTSRVVEFTQSIEAASDGNPAAGCEVLASSLRESCFGPTATHALWGDAGTAGQLAGSGPNAVVGSTASGGSGSATIALAVIGVIAVVVVGVVVAVRATRERRSYSHDLPIVDQLEWRRETHRTDDVRGHGKDGISVHAAHQLEWDNSM